MTDMVYSHAPGVGAVIAIHDQLLGWLCERALPLWDVHGVDRVAGGYFETLESGTDDVFLRTGRVRRGRVVARQIFAFDVGHRMGWRSSLANPVDHGCRYLFANLHAGDGIFHTSVDADTGRPVDSFSLYEQAFYLFALARLAQTAAERHPIRGTAVRCLEQLRGGFGKANGGFDETIPPTLPLKSNPHMHLLEAALAWIEVSDGSARLPWVVLAQDMISLCLAYFVDGNSGSVREYFGYDWRPASGDQGRIVEPGHQFEWAWLLLEWTSTGLIDGAARQVCVDTALHIMEIGERWGVDHLRGIAINEIWSDMSIKDSNAKLWPQTERLKAWCGRLARARTAEDLAYAAGKVVAAGRGLWQYLRVEPCGLWHEVWSANGAIGGGPSKASSFYHVVSAVDVLSRTVGNLGSNAAAQARP